MSSHLFTLSTPSDVYVLLSFRAKNLTHVEKIEIILEIENSINQTSQKHIHLTWVDGYANSNLTIWSESDEVRTITFDSIKTFFSSSKYEKHDLPLYLQKKMNTEANFIVFPNESYVQSMLGK